MSMLSGHSPVVQPVGGTDEWRHHEHTSDTAKAHAQQLVETLGSVELAKHAVEAVGDANATAGDQGERAMALCGSLGFANYAALLERSTPAESNDGNRWFETELDDKAWVVWNEEHLEAERRFATRHEALASVPHNHEFSGSSLLG